MNPRKKKSRQSSEERKRLVKEDPRKNSRGTARRRPETGGLDSTTAALTIVAVILLALVLFLMIRRPGSTRTAAGEEIGYAEPAIERVQSEENLPPEPAELGVPEETIEPEAAEPVPENKPETAAAEERTARLFFVKVNDEGQIGIKSVLRSVPSTASPLTTAVTALTEGPRPGELSSDLLSLLPEDTRLIGARVEDGIAFLDFNEAFRFNALGIEGYRAQVEQVVYTATEFPTVDRVQFLIEGQRIDFLGGEGFWVGGPIGRDDF